MMSSAFSRPTESRIRPSSMPAVARSSGVMCSWVMVAGCIQIVRLVPNVTAWMTSCRLSMTVAAPRIPPGTTTTYGAVAASIGAPRAVRAVANAIAANRVGYLVPCHGVLRENGAISGYAWGPDRKRAILARELATTTAG